MQSEICKESPAENHTCWKIRELPTLDRFKKQPKVHLKSETLKHNPLEEQQ